MHISDEIWGWRVNVRFEVRQNNIVLIKKRLEIYKYKYERKVYRHEY
jgi:hypothetical protein